ncbi:class I SAM-dependent methyltransferase [Microvirga lotononidis]|uniref:Putative O-methyltransferase n=1 Tax=Microvirga lotononidis TaxID=864069 RepID=I4YUT8_9HYPH|nr:class I SAM-dependent methyltransferase [Microvirga lotononidis]EIM27730.1 putative O-methyltransferase [Microvirga lotononidis]WQO28132.1 class I SAM-dependent methyltransferase [Microvirga lotononidis]
MSPFWRRLRFGLSTLLGVKRLGFFIPYRYAESVEAQDYPALRPLFEAAQPRFSEVLEAIESHAHDLRSILEGRGPARFDQSWFPRLDAAAAYAIVRRERPRRIVEIGSGHSTRFMAQAVQDEGLATRITCIDPAPRATLRKLDVEHRQALLRDADPGVFEALEAGDILFIDSSHIAMPGTDVDRLFLDALPRLASGTLVHIHDIALPHSYPAVWEWRGYNEQLLVGALLQGGGYDLVFASHHVAGTSGEALSRGILSELPLVHGAHETSLWLRKK